MRAKIQKWGNSLGLRLPKVIAKEAFLVDGSEVDITADGVNVVVRPVHQKHYRLADLLKEYPKNSEGSEMVWGEKQGREVW